jgi:hypothetical protein
VLLRPGFTNHPWARIKAVNDIETFAEITERDNGCEQKAAE